MISESDALAYWRAEYDVVTHVARCECDDCVEVRELALAES